MSFSPSKSPRREGEPVWSVTEVNRAVRDLIEGSLGPFWITGEVSGLLLHRSGHAYMTLKDADSQLRVCYFGGVTTCRKLGIADGMRIEALGKLTVYTVRGEYQFTVKELRPAGTGDLARRFEELKKRLAAEGLFDPARKKPIPVLPETIAVVSSPTGAALRDFLQVIGRRFGRVHLRIVPCRVQGVGAEREITAAVEFLNRTRAADVIVVTRGGGSIEDLWAFNDETLARTIAASRIPVISAVGHEIDFTICDFVADLRAPTPSAAAELVISAAEELTRRLDHAESRLTAIPKLALAEENRRLDRLKNRLATLPGTILAEARRQLETLAGSFVFTRPETLWEAPARRVDDAELRLIQAVKTSLTTNSARLDRLETALSALDPRRQLERGYAMVLDPETGSLITSSNLPAGHEADIRFADGSLRVIAKKRLEN